MGQEEVLKVLEKAKIPLAVSEIAELLSERTCKISLTLSKLLKYSEIEFIEIDRVEAMKRYGCKHRMKLYFVS